MREQLTDDEAVALLACYGITLAEFRQVEGAETTVAAAEELGYPVAVKAVGAQWRTAPTSSASASTSSRPSGPAALTRT